jgi:hypothetical protein
MVIKNKKSGKFERNYSDKDKEMFKDWIKSGTTYGAFTRNVMRLFEVSAVTATKWYYDTKKELKQ